MDAASMGVLKLAHFMHKKNTFSLTAGGLKPEQGAEPPHFNYCM